MTYVLKRRILGDNSFVLLTLEEYNAIANARDVLLHALYIEEKFDLVLQNYADVERELLNRAVNHVLFCSGDWTHSIGELHVFNRRMINLLTTCRLYLDQVAHNIRGIYGRDSGAESDFKSATHKEYDSYLGYRALEALRNYVQHRGFPVHQITLSGTRLEEHGVAVNRTIVIPYINTEILKDDKEFKSATLTELQGLGRLVDARPLFREYLSSIGRVHEILRQHLQSTLSGAEEILTKAQANFQGKCGQSITGLAAVHLDEEGNALKVVQIFDDFITRRQVLADKNRNASHFAWHFVSNAAHVPM